MHMCYTLYFALIEAIYLVGLLGTIAVFLRPGNDGLSSSAIKRFSLLAGLLFIANILRFSEPVLPESGIKFIPILIPVLSAAVFCVFPGKLKNTLRLLLIPALAGILYFLLSVNGNPIFNHLFIACTGLYLGIISALCGWKSSPLCRKILFLFGLYLATSGLGAWIEPAAVAVISLTVLNLLFITIFASYYSFKKIVLIFLIPSFLFLCLAAAWHHFVHHNLTNRYLSSKTQEISRTLVQVQMKFDLSKQMWASFAKIATSLPIARNALTGKDNPKSIERQLKMFRHKTHCSAVYIMNNEGTVIASSLPSINGNNYSFRPYFQQAIQGIANLHIARGIISNEVGLYAARPIFANNKIIGVLVIKNNLDGLIGTGIHQNEFILMHKSGYALEGPEQFAGSFLFPITQEKFRHLRETKIFDSNLTLKTAGFTRIDSKNLQDNNQDNWLMIQTPIHDNKWYLVKLEKLDQLLQYQLLILAIILPISIIILLAIHWLLHTSVMTVRIRDEQQRLLTTIKAIGDGVICTDHKGRIVLMNSVAEELTGWKEEEAAGQKLGEIFNIINQKDRKAHPDLAEKVIAGNKVTTLPDDTVLIAKDGTEKIITDSGAPITDEYDRIKGVVIVFRDETAVRAMEEYSRRNDKLESIGVLAGGIAHDFNNFLTAIMGNISLLKMTVKDSKVTPWITDMETATKRATSLTKQLLTFARGGAPVTNTICLAELIRETSLFTLRGSKAGLSFSFSDDIWAVKVDEGQMGQVIQNLVINAEQAMTDGGQIEISTGNCEIKENDISPASPGKYAFITVRDTGKGIEPELVDKIFDPFFTGREAGNGLGLAICFSIIKRHNGYIEVKSEVDKGTIFSIYLPSTGVPCRCATGYNEMPVVENQNTDKKKKQQKNEQADNRVLIMDDDPTIRTVAGSMLKILGYSPQYAADGEEAIAKYSDALAGGERFMCVLMDLTIPGGMGGAEAVTKLLAIDQQAVAIVVSGYANDPIMASYSEYGFKGALAKPFAMDDLEKTMTKIKHQTTQVLAGK